jgi:tellurite methyltransferase
MKTLIVLSTLLLVSQGVWAKKSRSSSQLQLLSGEKKPRFNKKGKWDAKFSQQTYVYGKAPARFLAENYDFIPANSKVLDIGVGEGRNAIFLAKKGHEVVGIDISSVAIKKSQMLAKENGVRIETILGTIDKYEFKPNSFDAIICFYLVDRELNKKIVSWLKPGGLLIYEAYTLKEKRNNIRIAREADSSFLREKELLSMFPKLRVLKYEEPLHHKEFTSSIILKKP